MRASSHWRAKSAAFSCGIYPRYNSGVNNYDGLSAFCRLPGARLDNNRVERTIKLVIRTRKNSLFYKTQNGADVGDTLISLMTTAIQQEVNVLDYLTEIQRNEFAVGRNPERWLPWNYHKNLTETVPTEPDLQCA